jgi:hypothetical protein
MLGVTADWQARTGVHAMLDGTRADYLANAYSAEFPTAEGITSGKFNPSFHGMPLGWDIPCYNCGPGFLLAKLRELVTHPDWQTPDFPDPLESHLLLPTPSGIGVLTRFGTVIELPGGAVSQPALEVLTGGGLLVQQAEGSPLVGRGPAGPHTLLVSSDGTSIQETLFGPAQMMLSGREVRATIDEGPRAAALGNDERAPAPRESFQAVYSRATARLFVIGGKDPIAHAPLGDIWFRSIDSGGTWVGVRTAYHPANVLAATYSYLEGRLWILDEVVKHPHKTVARLVTLDPLTGEMNVVGEWPRLTHFDAHWLLLDKDGSVLLAASSRKLRLHAVLRFVHNGSGARLLRLAQGFMPFSPVIDLAGYGFVVQDKSGAAPRVVRMTRLGPGGQPSHDVVGSVL